MLSYFGISTIPVLLVFPMQYILIFSDFENSINLSGLFVEIIILLWSSPNNQPCKNKRFSLFGVLILGGKLILIPSLLNKLGININLPPRIKTPNKENLLFLHGWLFGEDQSRIIISTNKPDELIEFSKSENVKVYCIGKTNKTGLVEIPKYDSICIYKCSDLYNNSIPNLFS